MVFKGERRKEKGEIPCGVKSSTCSSLLDCPIKFKWEKGERRNTVRSKILNM